MRSDGPVVEFNKVENCIEHNKIIVFTVHEVMWQPDYFDLGISATRVVKSVTGTASHRGKAGEGELGRRRIGTVEFFLSIGYARPHFLL